jgi:hypothetical protein
MSVRRRVARKSHYCSPGCSIEPGDVYLVHTTFPRLDDLGYATAAGHPVRFAECAYCATRYGRAELLKGTPTDD